MLKAWSVTGTTVFVRFITYATLASYFYLQQTQRFYSNDMFAPFASYFFGWLGRSFFIYLLGF